MKKFFFFFLTALFIVTAAYSKPPKLHTYVCIDPFFDLTTTINEDRDGDGLFDTYVSIWCVEGEGPWRHEGPIKDETSRPLGWKGVPINDRELEIKPGEPDLRRPPLKKKPKFSENFYYTGTNIIEYQFVKNDDDDKYYYFEFPGVGVEDGFTNRTMSITPNPVQDLTNLSYTIKKDENVVVKIFNQNGQTVQILNQGFQISGDYSLTIDATNLPTGIYYVNVMYGIRTVTGKMHVIH